MQATDSMDTTSYAAGQGTPSGGNQSAVSSRHRIADCEPPNRGSAWVPGSSIRNPKSEIRDSQADGAPAWARVEREIADEAAALRQELRETKRLIAELGPLAELGELVAFVAHEVRNPLAGIAATAEVLRDSLGPAGQGGADCRNDAVEGLNVILDEAARLERTVRNLLDFARSRQSRVRPCDVAADVGRLAQAIAAEGHAERAGVAVRVEHSQALPLVLADPELIQHAFSNVATNAIQAMAPGGTLTIRTLEPEADSGYVCVEFADTGCGIPADDLPKIFDPFFTTRTGGVGLGLAAASKLIEHLGGSITVESEVGRGSRFTVWLRRAPLPSREGTGEGCTHATPSPYPLPDRERGQGAGRRTHLAAAGTEARS